MSALAFGIRPARDRCGFKGPRAAGWLGSLGLEVPAAANTWCGSALFVARLGTAEFFIEDDAGGVALRGMIPGPDALSPGVYPVLREDAAFLLSGDGTLDVLAQVCSIDFARVELDAKPVIMTSMIGVSVMVLPYQAGDGRCYAIWCDPTFGRYLEETVGLIVTECGGNHTGVSI